MRVYSANDFGDMMKNLNDIASQVATEEGGKRSTGGVAQITEIMGVLGRRWRGMSWWESLREFRAIRNRAGK